MSFQFSRSAQLLLNQKDQRKIKQGLKNNHAHFHSSLQLMGYHPLILPSFSGSKEEIGIYTSLCWMEKRQWALLYHIFISEGTRDCIPTWAESCPFCTQNLQTWEVNVPALSRPLGLICYFCLFEEWPLGKKSSAQLAVPPIETKRDLQIFLSVIRKSNSQNISLACQR